jgi:uncharacterized protein (TIGR02118 family)
MTIRMAVYYKKPEDPTTFEKRYVEEHLPLTQRYQGIAATSFFKVGRRLVGESPYSYVFVGIWDEFDDFKAAMTSDVNKEVAEHAKSLGVEFDVVMLDEIDIWGM